MKRLLFTRCSVFALCLLLIGCNSEYPVRNNHGFKVREIAASTSREEGVHITVEAIKGFGSIHVVVPRSWRIQVGDTLYFSKQKPKIK